jgi:E3 ubiquitin-protein ligase BOI and related proteins
VTVPPVPFLAASGKSRRKRPREECVSLFTVQPQQSTAFASVALFQNHQIMVSSSLSPSPSPAATTLVSTGLRLAFDEQQQQLQQQDSKQTNAFGYPSSPSQSGSVSDELAAQVKRHDEEIDRFVREQVPSPFPCTTRLLSHRPPILTRRTVPGGVRSWSLTQGEQLRRAVGARRRRPSRAILAKAERSAAARLREKASEAEREARRGAELEERLARLRGEAGAWQAKALSEQAAAATLHAQLQQQAAARASAEEQLAAGGGDAGAAQSSSSAYVDPRRSDRACLGCRLRPASVVLIPCRHLPLCGECFAAGDADAAMACPVCLCVRTGSVEAILC